MKTKPGFTLLELIVVIAIIALLVGVTVSAGSGAIENARAAKCLTNLKSLGAAAANYQLENNKYPLAGCYEIRNNADIGGKTHFECVGWIAWLSFKGTKNKLTRGDFMYHGAMKHQDVEICPYYGTGNPVRDHFALSRGKLWKHVYKTDSVYVCPTHKRLCEKAKLGSPLYSYVMNARFGYDYLQGKDALDTTDLSDPDNIFDPADIVPAGILDSGSFSRPDKVLLFAELQGDVGAKSGFKTTGKKSDIYECDAVLQYAATVDGKALNPAFGPWKGKPECIGFNHRGGQNRYFAHVVFVDGHTEKLQAAKAGKGGMLSGGLTYEQLTAILCAGKDYSYNGQQYHSVADGKEY